MANSMDRYGAASKQQRYVTPQSAHPTIDAPRTARFAARVEETDSEEDDLVVTGNFNRQSDAGRQRAQGQRVGPKVFQNQRVYEVWGLLWQMWWPGCGGSTQLLHCPHELPAMPFEYNRQLRPTLANVDSVSCGAHYLALL
jgi:hypothetical protein